jgi:hypothetical protein
LELILVPLEASYGVDSFLGRVQAVQTFSKIFSCAFLHHLIERDLLITKNYCLALENTSFRSKNTKYSKDADFFEKHIFCQNAPNLLLGSFFQLLKIIFSDSAAKTASADIKFYRFR